MDKFAVISVYNDTGTDMTRYLDITFAEKPDEITRRILMDNLNWPYYVYEQGSVYSMRFGSNSSIDDLKINIAKQALHLSGWSHYPEAFLAAGLTSDETEALFGASREPMIKRIADGIAYQERVAAIRKERGLPCTKNG